jgi:hypothetical protein
MTKIIESEWQALRQMAVNKNATEEHLLHLRRTFFCGAQSMLMLTVCPPEGKSEDEWLDELQVELREFAVAVREGTA